MNGTRNTRARARRTQNHARAKEGTIDTEKWVVCCREFWRLRSAEKHTVGTPLIVRDLRPRQARNIDRRRTKISRAKPTLTVSRRDGFVMIESSLTPTAQ